MRASMLDLRRRMGDVLRALSRGEPVTILDRGKKKGILYPVSASDSPAKRVSAHAAFGMWKDHKGLRDVEKAVRKMRRTRKHAV